MNTRYDVFEILSDGSAMWRACVEGTQQALERLKAVGKQTSNECIATDLRTKTIIARVNQGRSRSQINANEDRAAAT
jgi:hypothetical protein